MRQRMLTASARYQTYNSGLLVLTEFTQKYFRHESVTLTITAPSALTVLYFLISG